MGKLNKSHLQFGELDNVKGQTVKGANHTSPPIKEYLEKAKEIYPSCSEGSELGCVACQQTQNEIMLALAEAEEKGRQVTIEEIEKFINGIEETWINIPPLRITILKKLQEMRKCLTINKAQQ